MEIHKTLNYSEDVLQNISFQVPVYFYSKKEKL